MNFLDVKTDLAFKKAFGSKESKAVLISFLNAIVYDQKAQQIEDLVIVVPDTIPMLKGIKDTYVNVKARLNDGTQVIIEMQVLTYKGPEKLTLYNAAKNHSRKLSKSNDYTLLNPVIALNIVDFIMFDDSDSVTSRFKMFDKQNMIDYSNDIEMIFVELPKFTKAFEELEGVFDQWIYFLIHARTMDYIPDSFAPSLARAFSLIDESVMSEAELEAQHRRKEFIFIQRSSLELAEEKGLERGLEKGRNGTVLKMIELGIADETIIQVTGLSQQELEKIR